jgi:cobalamin synthase
MRRTGYTLRRLFSPWLMWLALLIPLAQSAAGVHAISHIAREAQSDEGKSSKPLADHCPQCVLAAALGSGALPAAPVAWVAPMLRHALPASAAAHAFAGGCASAYLSRAPPFLA